MLGDVAHVERQLRHPDQHRRTSTASAPTYLADPASTPTPRPSRWSRPRATCCPRSRPRRRRASSSTLDFDQSVFVRAAIENVVREAVISSILVSLMILLFLGSWRSTVIVVGVDPAVDLRRHRRPVPDRADDQPDDAGRPGAGHRPAGRQRHRHDREHPPQPVARQAAHRRHPRRRARGRAAADGGDARDLHRVLPGRAADRPGALPVHSARHHRRAGDARLLRAVLHAWCRRCAHSCSPARSTHGPAGQPRRAPRFERGFDRFRDGYGRASSCCLARRAFVLVCVGVLLVVSAGAGARRRHRLLPDRRRRHHQAAFPRAGRARGSRRPRSWCADVEDKIREIIPAERAADHQRHDRRAALLQPRLRAVRQRQQHGRRDPDPAQDAAPPERTTTCARSAAQLPDAFPGCAFYFQTADIVSQVLNFGLSAPIDVQIQDPNFDRATRRRRSSCCKRCRRSPASPMPHIVQVLDYPALQIDVDRLRAAALGISQRDVANNLLISLSSSSLVAPSLLPQPAEQRQLLRRGADADRPDQQRRRSDGHLGRASRTAAAPTTLDLAAMPNAPVTRLADLAAAAAAHRPSNRSTTTPCSASSTSPPMSMAATSAASRATSRPRSTR